MKKMIRVIALLMLLATLLCGCSKFTCDMCDQEKSGVKHSVEFFGQELVICDDCMDGLEALGNMLS